MIIKSYTAATVAEALKSIRDELGGDAIVLRTGTCLSAAETDAARRVEVTACADEAALQKRPRLHRNKSGISDKRVIPGDTAIPAEVLIGADQQDWRDRMHPDMTSDHIPVGHSAPEFCGNIDERIKPIFRGLIDADVPMKTALRLARQISTNDVTGTELERTASAVLKSSFEVASIRGVQIRPGMTVLFAGPSGSGKSSIMAKLAAQLVSQYGQKTKVLFIDDLSPFTSDKAVALADVRSHAGKRCIGNDDRFGKQSIALMDTPPLNRDQSKTANLLDRIRSVNADILFLCFSILMRTRDLIDTISIYRDLKPHYLIATHLDESNRWGGILGLTEYLKVPVAFISDSPGGTGFLKTPDPEQMARYLLSTGVR
jgi:flagellar biosynthesis protein FlhF